MAKYKIVLRPTAEKDLQKLKKSGNAASIEIITTIFNDLENHPYTGIRNLFVLAWCKLLGIRLKSMHKLNRSDGIEKVLKIIKLFSRFNHQFKKMQ